MQDVALIAVMGPLAQRGTDTLCAFVDGYDLISARLAAALESDARAVVLVVDSPGGDVAGLAEAVRRMRAMVEQSGKPVLAYVDELAASAAYWLAAGVADEIRVPPTGQVGSIGTIAIHVDESARLEKKGYAVTVVRSPDGKALGNSVEPLSGLGLERIQRDVDSLSAAFVAAIAGLRGLEPKAVRDLNADVLMGEAAVEAGLADGVSTLEQTISRALQLAEQREADMKMREAIATLLGAPASASDDDIAKAASASGPIMNLGRLVLSLADTTDPVAATKALSAAFVALNVEKVEAPKRASAADAKRMALMQRWFKGGDATEKRRLRAVLDPGKPDGVDNLASHWASMSLEQLEAVVGPEVEPIASKEIARPAARPADGIELTAGELADARAWGLDPQKMLEMKRQIAAQERA